uniref:Uncharacterized protein n=1 Tax=viral metagenome TaxID=1070528 RepID=A0A6C0JLV4_9ZZZZ
MVKFNMIGAGVVGGLALVLMAWFLMVQRDRGNMGDTDAIYIWAFVVGIIGFIGGGFFGGSFEKFENETDEERNERKKRLKRMGLI